MDGLLLTAEDLYPIVDESSSFAKKSGLSAEVSVTFAVASKLVVDKRLFFANCPRETVDAYALSADE